MTAVRGLLVALLLAWALAAAADVPVPPLTGRVVDLTGTLTSSEIASLTKKLEDFENRKGSQIAVLMVPTTQPETIEQFSIRVADAWKVGRKNVDDGAILVVAKNDRRVRIEVGYGLEGSLTDATTHRIIDEDITPRFRNGDFYSGISAGVDRMMRVIDGEELPPPKPQQRQSPPLSGDDVPVLIIVVLIVSGILRAVLGRLVGSAATGVLVGVLAWMIAGSLALSVTLGVIGFFLAFVVGGFAMPGGGGYWSRGGGWSGGSSGGSDRSGDSGGGFSGGGGGFGGGGASGSW
jgi:uncharacterized protein